jgi:hypothetical protein
MCRVFKVREFFTSYPGMQFDLLWFAYSLSRRQMLVVWRGYAAETAVKEEGLPVYRRDPDYDGTHWAAAYCTADTAHLLAFYARVRDWPIAWGGMVNDYEPTA